MSSAFPAITLQDEPRILVAVIPGKWLLKRTTPSWRIEDPIEGFQRRVSEDRAREIATAVLDQGRTFPNAIVLATNAFSIEVASNRATFPERIRFLVVDGQHRLWAQKFSTSDAHYCCLIHVGLTEIEMAQLFVEINDNQKRVPSSLRWDLVRLVKPEDDPHAVRAVDLIYELDSARGSPLYQRVDLTGEQHEISLKQGSLAPSIKSLVSRKGTPLHGKSFDDQLLVLKRYFTAIRECDADGWRDAKGALYKARVLRALLRALPDIVEAEGEAVEQITIPDFLKYLSRLDLKSLDSDRIRGQQGSAGIKAIYNTICDQIFE